MFYDPMLAHPMDKKLKHVTFPGFVQPKLDGIRMIWGMNEAYTRNGKEMLGVPKLVQQLEQHFDMQKLDGELYTKDIPFESIVSSVRRTVNIKEDERVQYWVFDCIARLPFNERMSYITFLFASKRTHLSSRLVLVPTYEVHCMEDIDDYLKAFEDEGYEGLIYRSFDGPYEYKRSKHLLKLKSFKDCEGIVIDFVEGKGKYVGMLGAVVVKLPGPETCEVGTGFDDAARAHIWNNKKKYLGKSMTIKYQELTKKNIPRFPVFITWRNYE